MIKDLEQQFLLFFYCQPRLLRNKNNSMYINNSIKNVIERDIIFSMSDLL